MTDKELLILLKENTESELRELLRTYGPAFCTIARNVLRDLSEENIEEVISDILVGKKKNMAVYRLQ